MNFFKTPYRLLAFNALYFLKAQFFQNPIQATARLQAHHFFELDGLPAAYFNFFAAFQFQ